MSVDTFSPRLLAKVDRILHPMTPEERKAALKPSVDAAQQFLDSPEGQSLDWTAPNGKINQDAIGSAMARNGHSFTSISGYQNGFKVAKRNKQLKFKSDASAPVPAPALAAAVPAPPKKEKVVAQPIVVEAPVAPAEEIIKPSAEFMIQAHETIQNFMFSPAAREVVLDGPAMESIINILLKSNLPPTQQGLQTAYEAAKAQGLLVIRVDHAAIARAAAAKAAADAKAVADAAAHAKEHRLDWLTLNWVREASSGEIRELMDTDAEAKAKIESLWNGNTQSGVDKLKRDMYEKQGAQNENPFQTRRNHAEFVSDEERQKQRDAVTKARYDAEQAHDAAVKEFEDKYHTLGEKDAFGRSIPADQLSLIRSSWTRETQEAWARIDDKYRVLRAYTENNDGRFTDSNGRINHARVEDARRGKGPKVEAMNTAVDALPIDASEAQLRKATKPQIVNYITRRKAAGLD